MRLGVIKIADVDNFGGLLRNGFDERRIIMPQNIDRYACQKVNIFLAVDVVEICALAALQNDFVTLEHRQIIFVVALKNFLFRQINHSFKSC